MSDTAPVCQPLTQPILLFGVSVEVLMGFMVVGFVLAGYKLWPMYAPMGLVFILIRQTFEEDAYIVGSWLEGTSFSLSKRELFEP